MSQNGIISDILVPCSAWICRFGPIRTRFPLSVISIALSFVLAGCVSENVVGRLVISGPGVTVNRQPAQSGQIVNVGDEVATGPGVSAVVLFVNGGLVQLDENTDPIFGWEWFGQLRCAVVKMISGQAAIDKTGVCFETRWADAAVRSLVNVRVSADGLALTLVRGSVFIERPQRVELVPGQEAVVGARAATVQVQNLTEAQLQERLAWRYRYPGLPTGAPMLNPSPAPRSGVVIPPNQGGPPETPSSGQAAGQSSTGTLMYPKGGGQSETGHFGAGVVGGGDVGTKTPASGGHPLMLERALPLLSPNVPPPNVPH